MEPKDLKNSDELKRLSTDDSEAGNEMNSTVQPPLGEVDNDAPAAEISGEDESVLDAVNEAAESADALPLQESEAIVEDVKEKTIVEKIAEEAKTIEETVEETAEDVTSKVDEVVEEVKEEAAEVVENLEKTAESVVGEEVVEKVISEAEEIAENLTDTTEKIVTTEAVEAVAEGIVEAAENAVPDEAIAEVVAEAAEIVEKTISEEVVEEVASETSDLVEKVVETAENVVAEEVKSEVEKVVEKLEKPVEAVAQKETPAETTEAKEDIVAEEKPVAASAEAETAKETTEEADVETDDEESDESDEEESEGEDEDESEEDEEEESSADEPVDYSQFSQIELINNLRELVESGAGRDRQINMIITAFNLKVKENNNQLKKQFVEEGGNSDDFVAPEDPYEKDIRDLVRKHRQNKFERAKRFEIEKEENLQKKYALIEEIKNLLNTEESINRTFQEFRELQKQWYELGPVPQSKMKELWDVYHFHVENFYDYIKINKELRDLDLKKNLEAKINLCERAEELLIEPSVIRAFNALQKLHEHWREIGPVPRDKKDEIWERFKAVTTAINQKHQEFFEKRKGEQKRNLEAKIALCEKVEEIGSAKIESYREWDSKSKQLIELQKVWRTIGFAPKRDNNKIYDRFRSACDRFFNRKREFYAQNKEVQNKNMQMKIDLCLEAESMKESTDWKKTTQQYIEIQKRWKEIGPVPRRHSDMLWKRFRSACDFFFENKSMHFSDIDEDQLENLKQKQALVEEVQNFKPGTDVNESLKVLREFQRRWTEIGHVPLREKDSLQNRFRAAVNKHYDSLKMDDSKRDSLKFRSKIATMTENTRGLSKVRQERERYMTKLKQLESDLILLDNNIGFFANSKNAQSLIADVNKKIDETREKIEMLKEKIRIIDDLDKTEY